tara:strand:- start:448 stop:1188 length:741 start_codon:yes stop_codon:yes gene_type:complete
MVGQSRYQNKKIAIYGMGLTGCSAAKTLKKLKADIFCWDDSAKIRKKIKNLNIPVIKFWLNKKSFDNILISPGIDIKNCKISNFLVKNFSKIITDLDIFFDLNKDKLIISVTGTNGKSTTCKIIEEILRNSNHRVKVVGNIGNPILSFYKKNYIFVLEASSYQLQYSKIFRSRHAAILNVSPDHLDRHKNMKDYIKIKSKIFFAQTNNDYSYINLNNKYSKSLLNIFKKRKIKSKLVQIKKKTIIH